MRYVHRPDHPMADEFGLVDIEIAGPKYSSNVAAYVITDEMPATRHMADNRHYTSKAKFRQATRDAGCVEVGNETTTLMKPRKPVELSRSERRDAIRKVISQLR